MQPALTYHNNTQKIFLAKFGYHPVFGKDVDAREAMNDDEALLRFEEVWNERLNAAIVTAQKCSPEDALEKLDRKQREHFDSRQEHRDFRIVEGLFVVQINRPANVTQLWFIRSSNVDPRTLFVKFETVEQRENFKQFVEEQFRFKDYELALHILNDFESHLGDPAWQEIMRRIRLA